MIKIGFVIGLLAGVLSISFFWVAEIRRVERMLEDAIKIISEGGRNDN